MSGSRPGGQGRYDLMLVNSFPALPKFRSRSHPEKNWTFSTHQNMELMDLKRKLERKTREAGTAQARVNQLYLRFRETVSRERRELEAEIAGLNRELECLRKLHDLEATSRTDLEAKLGAKEEELASQGRRYEQEIEGIKTRRQEELEQMEERLQEEYEVRLQQNIQEQRLEYDEQLQVVREEMVALYEQKASAFKCQIQRYQSSCQSKGEELAWLSSRCDCQMDRISSLESENSGLLNQVKELETKFELDGSEHLALLEERDKYIKQLVSEKSALMSDVDSLMEANLTLNSENASYRNLLAKEPSRLTLVPKESPILEALYGGDQSQRGTKRKHCEEQGMDSHPGFDTKMIIRGDIEIFEDDLEGNFIRLRNISDREVSIAGYQLLRLSEDMKTIHEFHNETRIDPQDIVTVWSFDAVEGTREPPQNIVMKEQKWFTSAHFKTVLISSSGDEQAVRETRLHQTQQRKRKLRAFGLEEGKGITVQGCVIA